MTKTKMIKLAIRGIIASMPFFAVLIGWDMVRWSLSSDSGFFSGMISLMIGCVVGSVGGFGVGRVCKYIYINMPKLWDWTFTDDDSK